MLVRNAQDALIESGDVVPFRPIEVFARATVSASESTDLVQKQPSLVRQKFVENDGFSPARTPAASKSVIEDWNGGGEDEKRECRPRPVEIRPCFDEDELALK